MSTKTKRRERYQAASASPENAELAALVNMADEIAERGRTFLSAHLKPGCSCPLCRYHTWIGNIDRMRGDLATVQHVLETFGSLMQCDRISTPAEWEQMEAKMLAEGREEISAKCAAVVRPA